jgi:hypothetical protein
VKWFNSQKGYGFIQPDDGTKDVFVQISTVERAGIGYLVAVSPSGLSSSFRWTDISLCKPIFAEEPRSLLSRSERPMRDGAKDPRGVPSIGPWHRFLHSADRIRGLKN